MGHYNQEFKVKDNSAVLMVKYEKGVIAYTLNLFEMSMTNESGLPPSFELDGEIKTIDYLIDNFYVGNFIDTIYLQHKIAEKEMLLNLKHQGF